MTLRLATIAALAATPALAHPGHLAEASGHSHWELLAGIAVIAVVGLPVLVRMLRQK